jgi:hypothetical protein
VESRAIDESNVFQHLAKAAAKHIALKQIDKKLKDNLLLKQKTYKSLYGKD